MSKNVENRTLSVILEELNSSIDQYNLSHDGDERGKLADDHKKLAQEYNQLSMLTAYTKFMDSEVPLVALAKAYYYDVISVKDKVHNEVVNGVAKSSITRSVVDGEKKHDIAKFIEWTEERNKSVAAAKDWKAKVGAARSSIENEWKRFFASKSDKKDISIGKVKKAAQAAFDALVFIPCENSTDKNAIIADGDVAKGLIAFANSRKDARIDGEIKIKGEILPRNIWNVLLLDALHNVVEDKKYELVYGLEDEDAKAKAQAVKAEAEADSAEESTEA